MPTDECDATFAVALSPAFVRQLERFIADAGGGSPEAALRRIVEGAVMAHAAGFEMATTGLRESLATSDAEVDRMLARSRVIGERVAALARAVPPRRVGDC